MKKQEKAIAIAKDVLHRLKLEKLNLARKTGFIVPVAYTIEETFPKTGSLQKQIDKAEANCQVCALGGIFLSHVRLHNGIQCDKVYDGSFNFHQISSKLRQIFSAKTLALIEGVFEGGLLRAGYVLDKEEKMLAYNTTNDVALLGRSSPVIVRQYPSYIAAEKQIKNYHNAIVKKARKDKKLLSAKAKTRALMTEICKNIIRNNGEFVLPSV
jgi:hypothetical protein